MESMKSKADKLDVGKRSMGPNLVLGKGSVQFRTCYTVRVLVHWKLCLEHCKIISIENATSV